MITCQQCRDDLAEFDLGAADAARAEQVAAHLAACPACRQELREVRAAWGAMPLSLTPIEPSSDVFDRVLARIDHADAPVAAAGPQAGRTERVLSYLVAASVVIGLTVGLWRLGQPAEDPALRQSAESLARRLGKLQEMERLLSDQNVRLVSMKQGAAGGKVEGVILWDMPARQWHFYASHLPPAPAGHSYRVWVVGPDGRHAPGPNLKVDAHNLGSAVVDLPPLDVSKPVTALVTLEPAGKSERPTGDAVLEASL